MRGLRIVAERPGWVLAAAALATLVAAAGLVDLRSGRVRLRIDPSAEVLLPAGGEARQLYDRSRRMLGGEDPIVVALAGPRVYERESLARLARLDAALARTDGVARVVSLATAMDVRSQDGDVVVAPFVEGDPPDDPAALAGLARAVSEHPLYRNLVSADGRVAMLLVHLEEMSDLELVERGIVAQVGRVARHEAGDAEVWISGFPYFKSTMNRTLQRDLAFILPIVVVVLAIALAVAFRSVRGVCVPLATIAVSLVWTLGSVAWLGGHLNVVTVIVPPLILTLGFAYTMHVMFDYTEVLRSGAAKDARQAVRHALDALGVPVLVTGVTTAAGFVALCVSPIPGVRQFGLFSLLGVCLTLLACLTFAPALLALLPLPRRPARAREARLLDGLAERLADFALGRRRLLVLLALGTVVASLLLTTRIHVANDFLTAFAEDAPVRRDFERINARLGGANVIQILVEGDAAGLLEPERLRAIRRFQDWLEAQPEVGGTRSIADYLMLLNRAFHDGDPAHFRVPERAALASQLLFLGSGEESARLLDASGRVANLTVLSQLGDSGAVRDLVDRIEERARALPDGLRASVTGSLVLVSRSVNQVAYGQWSSLLLAFAMIYVVLVLLFTSFSVGAIALLPNALPIVVYFGALGLTGVKLNNATSLVGCLALGIAVDDTIHYFARFNREAKRLGDERRATRATLRGLIHPATFTSVGLCLGFLALVMSELRPQVQFGALAAFTLAVAWVADVTLSPALCSGLRIVTLWDLLSLDLGEEPQRSIPLFHGLSLRQARLFTLLSDLREFRAGTPLLREGAPGQEMYVVVDGSLEAWVERDGHRVVLSHMSRGDTLGEVGLFSRGRSASVDVVEDARLIRFDPEDLDRLRRRHPRIAAVVYRNLNQIQAERLARTTTRVR